MQPLNQVITAVRKEIESSLLTGDNLPQGAHLEAERIVLSLQLSFEEQQNGTTQVMCGVPARDTASSRAHTLTIEFKLPGTAQAPRTEPTALQVLAPPSASPSSARLEGAEASRALESLTAIFGAPGFDSSARATVFREALADLSEAQVLQVVDALAGAPLANVAPTVNHAQHLVRRILQSSSTGVEGGHEVLETVFKRYSVKPVLQLIKEKWKTQNDWL